MVFETVAVPDWPELVIHELPSSLAVINQDLELEWTNASFVRMFNDREGECQDPAPLPGFLRESLKKWTGRNGLTGTANFVLEDRANGGKEARYYMVFIQPLSDTQRFLLDVRDYTRRKADEDQAAQRDRLASVGQISVGIAHEINNPNAFIRLNVGNLKSLFSLLHPWHTSLLSADPEQKTGNHRVRDLLEKVQNGIGAIERGSERILKVVETLKTFGRGGETLGAVVDLPTCVSESLELCHFLSEGAAAIEVHTDPTTPPVRGSSLDLQLVIINLISNAWDSIRQRRALSDEGVEGLVLVRVFPKEDGRTAAFSVSDNGMGILEADRSRLFSPFFTTKPQGEGTGLGLALSYRIVQRHGGKMSFETEVKKGSVFYVELPSCQPDGGSAP